MHTKKVSVQFFTPKNYYEHFAHDVYFLLVENFSQTFFVGGMVRDILLHKKINDIDIATAASPQRVSVILRNHGIAVNTEHKNFGVIKAIHKDREVEITTFRKEVYTDSRYPKVTFTTSLLIDSKRRDFTVNSLYLQAKNGIIYDPCNGLLDIKNKHLKLIGNPATKLTQDPLRIIRAYKFAHLFGLMFDSKTERALRKSFSLVHTISQTRLQQEINNIKNLKTKKFILQVLKNS